MNPAPAAISGSRRVTLPYANRVRHQFGADPGLGSLPISFNIQVTERRGPTMLLACRFGRPGSTRVEIVGLSFSDEKITASAVAHSRVGEVVRLGTALAARAHGNPADGVDPAPRAARSARPIDNDDLRLAAAIYAFEHAAWGTPRIAVARAFGLTEASAHYWISRAAERFGGLPGVGRAA